MFDLLYSQIYTLWEDSTYAKLLQHETAFHYTILGSRECQNGHTLSVIEWHNLAIMYSMTSMCSLQAQDI